MDDLNVNDYLKSHIRTEEKDAMPLARQLLSAEDWAGIDRAFLDNEDPLFGGKAKAEYRELFHRIVSLAPESVGLGARSAGELQPVALRHLVDHRLQLLPQHDRKPAKLTLLALVGERAA